MKLKLILIAIVAMLLASAIAAAGSVTITPSQPTTDDTLTCKVSGSSATYNFYWFKGATQYSAKTGTKSTVPSSATTTGQTWTCKAFTPSSGYFPEMYAGSDAVTILPNTPVTLDECEDGIDNDNDGLVDMNDPGCSGANDDEEYNPPEPTYQCSDNLDNDNDGLTDMNDPGCTSTTDNDEYNYVEPTYQCSDNLDNDNDGLTDMNDPGCTGPHDNNEYNAPLTQCSDGLDNDNDGFIDLADPGCTSTTDNDEYNEIIVPDSQCEDGLDNDNDGLVDMNDPGCESAEDDDEYNEPTEEETCLIEKVWINDLRMIYSRLEVELGQELNVDVQLKCNIDSEKEIRLVGSIYAGEYEDIQDDTGLFIVKPGITYVKHMKLTIPEVMNTANNKLRIRLFDGQEAQKKEYNLYIKELRHNVAVQDIITNTAKAGEQLFIKVRAENRGYQEERDIKVTASFLGATASTYIDELEPYNSEEDTETANLHILIPESTPDGSYKLEITLKYGNEKTVETRTVNIESGIATISTSDNTLTSATQLPEELTTNKKIEMKVMIINLNDETKAYGISTSAGWATTEYEQLVTVEAGKAKEITITLTPTTEGEQLMTISVTANGILIAEHTSATEVKSPARSHVVALGSIGAIILLIGLAATVKSVHKSKTKEKTFY